jgi:hypothetical protein
MVRTRTHSTDHTIHLAGTQIHGGVRAHMQRPGASRPPPKHTRTLTLWVHMWWGAEAVLALARLQEADSCFVDGTARLASVRGRRLLLEGRLNKVCRNGWKPRQFFLCNDVLVYAAIVTPRRYTQARVLQLGGMEVARLDDPALQHGFQISSAKKSFQVLAADAADRTRWLDEVHGTARTTKGGQLCACTSVSLCMCTCACVCSGDPCVLVACCVVVAHLSVGDRLCI